MLTKMELIKSFTIDHLLLQAGIYIFAVNDVNGQKITTLDIRVVRPNYDTPMTAEIAHTIEHIGSIWLRNNPAIKDDVLYFGPMGCLTGFYLLVSRDLSNKEAFNEVVNHIIKMMDFISKYNGSLEEVGFTSKQCGNYTLNDLNGAKNIAANFVVLHEALGALCFEYPKENSSSSAETVRASNTPVTNVSHSEPTANNNNNGCSCCKIPKPRIPVKFPDHKKMPIRTPEQLKIDLKPKPLRNKRKPASNELF